MVGVSCHHHYVDGTCACCECVNVLALSGYPSIPLRLTMTLCPLHRQPATSSTPPPHRVIGHCRAGQAPFGGPGGPTTSQRSDHWFFTQACVTVPRRVPAPGAVSGGSLVPTQGTTTLDVASMRAEGTRDLTSMAETGHG